MIAGYLIALGPFFTVALLLVVIGLCWLSLWLLEKHGWRHWCGWAIVAAVALLAASMVLQVSR